MGTVVTLLLLLTAPSLTAAAETNTPPDFKELYELLRTNLAGMSEEELNRAAARGLLSELRTRVALVTNSLAVAGPNGPVLSKAVIFEETIGYFRVTDVREDLANELKTAFRQLSATNQIKGIVLDLRYSNGSDYAKAADVADLFTAKEQPLMNWGEGLVRSKEKKDAISPPVVVLVNRETSGAAEALAALIRSLGAGLILGGTTAGHAGVWQEFTLQNEQKVRVASRPILLGNGSQVSAKGVKPDIDVTVNVQDERAYYADAFVVLPKTNFLGSVGLSLTNQPDGTNRVSRRTRLNEAELVRERREGLRDGESTATRAPQPERPVIHDPALARALDLLKGLAVMQQSRS